MRVLITTSGIQEYIFSINHQAAGRRLRGRSAQLGLVIDRCLECFQYAYPASFTVTRNAGSRLELEFTEVPDDFSHFAEKLQSQLDEYSLSELRGQVWFVIAYGESSGKAHHILDKRKHRVGQAYLQAIEPNLSPMWQEERFVLPASSEREMTKEDAGNLPEAWLGQQLAKRENKYIWFSSEVPSGKRGTKVLDRWVEVGERPPQQGPVLALDDTAAERPGLSRKRLARYAPLCGNEQRLCDFDEIAEESTGAKFLGVLKADLDNLGDTFSSFPQNAEGEKRAEELSDKLERLFTDELEGLLSSSNSSFADCYVVYSGGDDLFMLGPWDQLIRFAAAFQKLLKQSVEARKYPRLALSAGLKLAHPKSPIRFLADDVEAALDQAKGNRPTSSKLKAKNCICIFDRILAWDELRKGIDRADRFIRAATDQGLSMGFLQHLQYYASQFRHYETGKIEGLRMVPLLQNDWHRNKVRLEEKFRVEMDSFVGLLVRPMDAEASASWREVDFATRFAIYALREKGGSGNG